MTRVLTSRRPVAVVKPALRGWIHVWSWIGFLAAGAALIAVAAASATVSVTAGIAVNVASVLGLFGVSAVYHRVTWRSAAIRTWMRRLDHSMIFLLIAGTYTPIAMLALPPATRTVVLAVVWGGAAAGMALKLAWPHAPRWVGVPLYLALGWVAVFVLPELLGHAAKDRADKAADKARGTARKSLSTAAQVGSAFAAAGLEMGQAIAKAAKRSAGAVKNIWGNNDTDTTKRT